MTNPNVPASIGPCKGHELGWLFFSDVSVYFLCFTAVLTEQYFDKFPLGSFTCKIKMLIFANNGQGYSTTN